MTCNIKGWSWMPSLFVLGLLLVACGEDGTTPPDGTSEAPPRSVRALLVEGVAHAEIQEWPLALELFEQAVVLAPHEPVAIFDVAVAHFHAGNIQEARQQLESLPNTTPPWLLARASYLRGKLAGEEGDREALQVAFRQAAQLDPTEAVYPYALAEFHRRLPQEQGALLQRAYELWPENARLAADFALWGLAQGDAATRSQGFAALEALATTTADPQVAAFLEKGRADIEREPDQPRVPPPLRIVLNLLLNGKRFRGDVAELMARQEVMPLAEPVAVPPTPQATAPEIHFSPMDLLLQPSLAEGELVLTAVVVDDAVEDSANHGEASGRETAISLLTDRAFYFLPEQGDAWERVALEHGASALLAGDLDDDGRAELVVTTDQGLQIWSRPGDEGGGAPRWSERRLAQALATAGPYREMLLVDFEHDGDLDLVALDTTGRAVLVTHRGEAGWGPPQPAPLPLEVPLERLASADLDGDADQDLVVATQDELLVLRNWRQGEFSLHTRMPLPTPALQLLPFDYDGDGTTDVVVLHQAALTFWRGTGQAGLVRDRAAEEGIGPFAGAPTLYQLAAADVDLDGDLDLLVAGDVGPSRLQNLGGGGFGQPAGLFAEPSTQPAAPRGFLPLDLDGDHDPDLLSWDDHSIHGWSGQGAEEQQWITIAVRGLAGKVPLDGRGVRLEVRTAGHTQTLALQRPNALLGLGTESPAVVKATWPNGISEYLFAPPVRARHLLQLTLRIEGSCPFLYASDGDQLRFVTDILGLAPLGMLAAPGRYVPADPEEYLRLPNWVRPRDGMLELAITEELREVAYLDQTELVVVDAPEDIVVMNGEQWLESPVDGLALRLLTPLVPPVAVRDHLGADALERVRTEDHHYLTPNSGTRRYQGAMEAHHLTLELPAEVAAAEHPALVMVGWLHWGNTSTNVARAQDPQGAPLFPYLEVGDGQGGWRRTSAAVGLPAGKTKAVVVDLTATFDPADPRLRITTDFEVSWDLLAFATLHAEESTEHRVHRLAPRQARLHYGGFSRWYRPSPDGPYLFDYSDRRPYPWRDDEAGQEVVLSWQEHEGYYTAFGPVQDLLQDLDDRLLVFGSGEELSLHFDLTALPPLAAGWRRTFFLHSEGWEKDGDPNVACSQTVLPLPYHGMITYPCPQDVPPTAGPADGGTPRPRWVPRHRLTRRVSAWASQP